MTLELNFVSKVKFFLFMFYVLYLLQLSAIALSELLKLIQDG